MGQWQWYGTCGAMGTDLISVRYEVRPHCLSVPKRRNSAKMPLTFWHSHENHKDLR